MIYLTSLIEGREPKWKKVAGVRKQKSPKSESKEVPRPQAAAKGD
jgi:hypothetical protein